MKPTHPSPLTLLLLLCSTTTPLVSATDTQSFALVGSFTEHKENLLDVNANGNAFYLNKNRKIDCDPKFAGCPNKKSTTQTQFSFDFDTSANKDQVLDLNVVVPGGQRVYIDKTDGCLTYNTTSTPLPTSTTTTITGSFTFKITGKPDEASPHGELKIPGGDANCVIGCPEGRSFKLYSKSEYKGKDKDKCQDVELFTVAAEGEPIYEYD